jgi:DNA-directed RNA polymerase specialized sigma24 family protein
LRDFHQECVEVLVSSDREKRKRAPRRPPRSRAIEPLRSASLKILIVERARFIRFLRSRMADEGDAETFLRETFCSALNEHGRLRRGETVIVWLDRVMRAAVAKHYGDRPAEKIADQLWRESRIGIGAGVPWAGGLRACVRGLLPTILPRYAELLLRLDLQGESKSAVACELKISVGTADVVLHRARRLLRRRLQALCAATTQENCLAALRDARTRHRS